MRLLGHRSIPPASGPQRLQRGLLGYLSLFAPHAFVTERQLRSSKPPSQLVFFHISAHFTATCGVPLASTPLKNVSFKCSSEVEPPHFTSDFTSRLRTLYTQ